MKECAKCKAMKPFLDFNRYKRSDDGFYHVCKECRYARQKELRGKAPGPSMDWRSGRFYFGGVS